MTDPKPGSLEARNKGCTCPMIDNHNGAGKGGNGEKFGWFYRPNCKVHGEKGSVDDKLKIYAGT